MSVEADATKGPEGLPDTLKKKKKRNGERKMYQIKAMNKITGKTENYCGNYFNVLNFLSDFNYTEVEYKMIQPVVKKEGK